MSDNHERENAKEDRKNQHKSSQQAIDAKARAEGTTSEKAAQQIRGKGQDLQPAHTTEQAERNDARQAEIDYGLSHSEHTIPAEAGYDPAHSGVRHTHNIPGKHVETPGRESGTS